MKADDAVQTVLTALKSGQTHIALETVQSALLRFPENADLLHLKAHVMRQLGRMREAIEAARAALVLVPRNFEIHNLLGNLLKSTGQQEQAVASYQAALRFNPEYEPAHANLVTVLIAMRAHAPSVAAGEAWVRATHGRSADALEALGRAQKARKAWFEATRLFQKARNLSPAHVAARYGEASCRIETGETEAARDLCAELVREGHQDPQILRLLARAQLELSDFDAAEPQLRRAVGAGSVEAVKDYANLLWMTARQTEALALLQGAIVAASDRPAQAIAGFDELLDMERPDLVVRLFDQLPDEQKTLPDFAIRLASAKGDLGETETAFALAEIAVQTVPSNRVCAYQFIVSSLMSARYDLALSHARNWREREPEDQNWITLEADSLRMLGQTDAYEALYDYERFVLTARLDVPKGFTSLEDFHTAFIQEVHGGSRFKTHPLGQSVRLGTQSLRNLVYDQRPVVRAYLDALQAPLKAYLDRIGTDPSHPVTARNTRQFFIGGCWSVSLFAGGRHVSHVHPNGWISSAYYMAVPSETKDDPVNRPGWIKFGEPPYKLPDAAPAGHWVCPEPGSLVLFPAYMWHGTVPVSGAAPRVTAPLDIQPGDAP